MSLPATIVALSLTLSLVLLGQGQVPRRSELFTVAVNTSTIEGGPVYLAEADSRGPRFTVINGGVRNLADGTAQVATNAETQMLLASTTNPRIRMLFTLAEGHYRIIGRKSAGINSLADLRGKRITTALQTSAHYYLFRMLKSAGVEESDVTLVTVDRSDMAQAVARRDADAIAMWEPEAQKALDGLGYSCWWHIASNYPPNNYFGNRERLWGEYQEANMLCFPKEAAVNAGGLWPVESVDDTFLKAIRRHSGS